MDCMEYLQECVRDNRPTIEELLSELEDLDPSDAVVLHADYTAIHMKGSK